MTSVLLINSKKVDLNYKNNEGKTAVHLASIRGLNLVVSKLIENQDSINVLDLQGNSPLYYAV